MSAQTETKLPRVSVPVSSERKADFVLLAERAVRYRQLILDVACGPGGMIISLLPYSTHKPFQESDEIHWWLRNNLEENWGPFTPRPTVAEWYYGENTLAATGLLLWSQILRYQATHEQE